MWARVIEGMLGVWLLASPFIFRIPGDETTLWGLHFVLSGVVMTLAALSYVPKLRHAHLVTLVVAGAMIAYGRFAQSEPPPEHQNLIFVGWLLVMFAVIPNHAESPPRAWQARGET